MFLFVFQPSFLLLAFVLPFHETLLEVMSPPFQLLGLPYQYQFLLPHLFHQNLPVYCHLYFPHSCHLSWMILFVFQLSFQPLAFLLPCLCILLEVLLQLSQLLGLPCQDLFLQPCPLNYKYLVWWD